jgi:hypothetical protein
VPACYRIEERSRRALWVTGIALSGTGYLFTVGHLVDAGFEDRRAWYLVPVVGGWAGGPEGTLEGSIVSVLSVMQLTGAILIGAGFATPKLVLVPDMTGVGVYPSRVGGGYGLLGTARF